jgi:hypothetical protein
MCGTTRTFHDASGLAARTIGGVALLGALCLPQGSQAQDRDSRTVTCSSFDGQRVFCAADTRDGVRLMRQIGDTRCEEGLTWGQTDRGIWVDRGCRGEFVLSAAGHTEQFRDREALTRIEPGTLVPVRTNETIASDRSDGRVFTGLVEQDVRDASGRLAIPRGSSVELMVRVAPDNDLVLDLESVVVNGQRYAVRADANRIEAPEGSGNDSRTGEHIGEGAVLGAIIGAIAGGGKGAAIGAVAGGAAGAGGDILTRGRAIRIPRDSILTFRLERPLTLGVADVGITRDGQHFHDWRGR